MRTNYQSFRRQTIRINHNSKFSPTEREEKPEHLYFFYKNRSRWSGAILSPFRGYCYFKVVANSMARLWLDGDLLLDQFTQQTTYNEESRRVYFEKNKLYEIELEYLKTDGYAYCQLYWSTATSE